MTDRASVALSKGTAGSDPLIGRVVGGRFKITALIARGGMGKVYRAEQAPLGRICAVKVLNPGHASEHDPEFHKRFFLEASVASKLTHPNTVTIFDYGRTDDDIYYMAMEYLEGHTLHRAIRDAGHLPEERVVHIARQICRALREAHSLGVIHRDLKPANIFLVDHGDEPDFVKVLDFGLVKNLADKGEDLTQTGMFMGSPKYMAPEQIRGDLVDARTDVYALGIILCEMLTGKVPFDRPTSVNILMAHVNEDAPPMRQLNPRISVSGPVEYAVLGCMAKDPEKRFRSMDEVLAALKRVGIAATAAPVTIGGDESIGPGPVWGPVERDSSSGAQLRGAVPPVAHRSTHVPRAGSKAVFVGAVAGALATVGALGYLAMRPPNAAPAIAPVAPSSAVGPGAATMTQTLAETATSTVAIPPAPFPMSCKIRVSSEPDGATVKENGVELCNKTPCDILYEGADADPAREHRLTLARMGYRVEVRSVRAADSPVDVKLTPAPRVAPQVPSDTPPSVPTGYKADIPY
jgi:eukaryotic-like serine/threonine-protein kinase